MSKAELKKAASILGRASFKSRLKRLGREKLRQIALENLRKSWRTEPANAS